MKRIIFIFAAAILTVNVIAAENPEEREELKQILIGQI